MKPFQRFLSIPIPSVPNSVYAISFFFSYWISLFFLIDMYMSFTDEGYYYIVIYSNRLLFSSYVDQANDSHLGFWIQLQTQNSFPERKGFSHTWCTGTPPAKSPRVSPPPGSHSWLHPLPLPQLIGPAADTWQGPSQSDPLALKVGIGTEIPRFRVNFPWGVGWGRRH